MKKLKSFAVLVAVLLCSITSNAQTLVDGIYFQFYDHWVDGKLEATAYVTHDGSGNYNCYSGDVVIPETVTYEGRTYTVNRVESNAFYNCPNLTSVSIPNSVKSMGNDCFYECTNLTSVNIPTDITSIESSCFYNCKKLANITIPNAVTNIYSHAFYGCSSLQEIKLPNQLTKISQYAFEKCHKLETIDIPSSVTSIGEGAFYDCGGLTDFTIPANVTSLGTRIFSLCRNLSSVTISCNITSLPSSIFSECSKLTSVTLPSSITSIGEYAFRYCSELKDITLPNGLKNIGNYAFQSCHSLNTTIPTTATSIGECAFTGGTITLAATDPSWLKISEDSRPFGYADEMGGGIKIVVADNAYDAYIASDNWSKYKTNIFAASELPRYTHTDDNGVTWKYRYIYSTKSLSITSAEGYTTNLVFPATLPFGDGSLSVEGVEFAISNNDVITSIDLSATSITKVGSYSSIYFYECPSLKSVLLPSTLEEMGYNAFQNCPSLETINWSNLTSLKTIGQYAFASDGDNRYSFITNIDLSATKVETIGSYAFNYMSKLKEIKFPSTLKNIGNYAFWYCNSLRELNLSQTQVAKFGEYSFSDCSGLQTVVLPATLKEIGMRAFWDNHNLREINLSNVETIADKAFEGCGSLYNIDLSSAKSIGSNAFTRDLTVTIDSSIPAAIKLNSFTKDTKFYVTTDAYDTFCTTSIWSNWANNISMYNIDAEGVKWMYRYLKDTNSMCITSASGYGQNVNVPSSVSYNKTNVPVTHIENAFNGADITSVTLPATLTTIGDHAFYNCSNLTSVIFEPNSVLQTIGNYAFASVQSWDSDYSKYTNKISSIEIPASVKTIGRNAFVYCRNLNSVTFEANSTLELIADSAFRHCKELATIEFPATLSTLGTYVFDSCEKLENIDFAHTNISEIQEYTFWGCHNLKDVKMSFDINEIGAYAFYSCSALTEIDLSKVQTIGSYAFNGVNLASIDLSSAISVGANAFSGEEPFFTINNTTPATIESGTFPSKSIFLVPGSAVNTYKTANIWNNYASRILDSNVAIQNLTLTAKTSRSDLEVQIGDANLLSVVDLTIKGSINSYDFMVMRNKMPFLRRLNLSEAHIVGNNYEHYTGYHTEDNKFPGYGLYNCKLVSLELPQSITEIGYRALSDMSYLKEVVIPEGVTNIDGYAFSNSYNLRTISTPKSLTSIGYGIFESCYNLEAINIPKGVTEIPSQAFSGCSNLEAIVLPPTIESIGWYAFSGCYKLKEIRIPSSVRRIENDAFSGTNIEDVYVHVVEPFDINQQTFAMIDNNFKGTLHAPKVSYWNYFYNTQWSQFLKFAEFDEPYDNFYLEGDKILDEETGNIRGEEGNAPDAELGSGSGLKVEDDITQDLGDVEIKHNGENGGSIIVDGTGEVTAENMTFHINVNGGRWYFFCFPFDIRKDDIRMENGAEWVFRYYDGELRASQGHGGWKDVTSDGNGNFLKAATGYVFQCSKGGVLTLTVKNKKFKKENKYNELVEHVAKNANDASWNFVGNPYLSYYEITSNDYSAPITVWDGYNYVAIRPGDDDYQLAPFEAFFVQKPNGVNAINYDSDNQMTHTEAGAVKTEGAARARQAINPDRLLVNLTLASGEKTDRTRVVFNNEANIKYEVECDAAKFASEGMPQLYSLDAYAVKYAINERPVAHGNVSLGYTAPTEGTYTLDAPRMDANVVLVDNATGTVHDFANGGYEFTTEAGTFDNRFILKIKGDATGLEEIEGADAEGPIYNIKGQQVKDMKRPGVYIKGNRKVMSR